MFENLTDRLTKAFRNMVGLKLTEDNMKETLKEVENALLEADVAYDVVQSFVQEVKAASVGLEITKELTPAQMLVKVVNDKLTSLMGEAAVELNLSAQPPVVILMAGLQGSGKTTSAAKLSKWLKERMKKIGLVGEC